MSKFTEDEKTLICNQAGDLSWHKVDAAQYLDHHEVVRTKRGEHTICISTAFFVDDINQIPCQLLRSLVPEGPCGIYQITVTSPEHRNVGLFASHAKLITDWLHAFHVTTFAVIWQYPTGEVPGAKFLETLGYNMMPAVVERKPECDVCAGYCPTRDPHQCGCQFRVMERNANFKKK